MPGTRTPAADSAAAMPAPAVMNVRQAAAYLGLHEKTLREILAAGHIRHSRFGENPQAEYKIRREWLDAYIELKAQGGLPPRQAAAKRKPRRTAKTSTVAST